jgi:hypothetical protein
MGAARTHCHFAGFDHEGWVVAEPHETGISARLNVVDPGFHGVPAAPAPTDRDAGGVKVT